MAVYKLTKENVAKVVAILRADARFSPELQKEIGKRAGRPNADGSIQYRTADGGLFTGAVASGFLADAPWYDEIFAAHGARIAE